MEDTNGYTSSPASEDGNSPLSTPDGRQGDLFGQDPAHANPSVWLAVERGWLTLDTYGRRCIGSSGSANLQRCLENKLRRTTDLTGSPEFVLTWRKRAMPSGVPICRLQASARPNKGSGSGGWPTPNVFDSNPVKLNETIPHWISQYLKHQAKDVNKQFNLTIAVKAFPIGSFPPPQKAIKEILRLYKIGHHWPNIGSLNPLWVEWLMGFPINWSSYADMATR